jgi:hypothetical protein
MAELDLNVNVNTKGQNKLRGVGDSLASMGRLAVLGGAAVAGGVAVAGAAFIEMGAEAENAQTKLKSVFDSTGAAAFTSIDALNAHAQALAAATTFDDDSINDAQTSLLAFQNITGDTFTRATEGAADLAAFMGTDIQSAAEQLGRALSDPEKGISRLRRAGLNLTDAQEEMVAGFLATGDTAAAQNVILDAVGEKFGTLAEDMAGTSSGQMTQAIRDLGEVGEEIGLLLLPVLAAIAQGFSALATFIAGAMPTIQAAIAPVIAFITSLFSGASGKLGGLNDAFRMVIDFWVANGPTLMSIAGQVFGAIANVIGVVAPVILNLAKVVMPILAVAAGALFTALDIAFRGIGGAFEVLGNTFETVAGVIEAVFTGLLGVVRGLWNAFVGIWNSIEISVPSVDIPFVGTVGGFSLGLPDLPMLAKGGIVTRPTLALIGESGPEAVVPLTGSQMAGVTNYFTYNVQSPIPDEKALVGLVSRSQRLQGMLPS